jgi:hypothetical protein
LFTIRSPFGGRFGHAGRGVAPSLAADFDKLEAERLDLGQDAMEGGLVGKAARQERVAVVRDRSEIRERRQEAITEKAADPDLEPSGPDSSGALLVHGGQRRGRLDERASTGSDEFPVTPLLAASTFVQ